MKILIKESLSLFKENFKIFLTIFSMTMIVNVITNTTFVLSSNLITYILLFILVQLLLLIPLAFGIYKSIYNICTSSIKDKLDLFSFYSSPYKVTFCILYLFVQILSYGILLPYIYFLLSIVTMNIPLLTLVFSLMSIFVLFITFYLQGKFSSAFFLFFDIKNTNSRTYINYALKLTKDHKKIYMKLALIQFLFSLILAIPVFLIVLIGNIYFSQELTLIFTYFYVFFMMIVSIAFDFYIKILKCKIYKYIIDTSYDNKELVSITSKLNPEIYFKDFNITDTNI